MSEVLEGRLRSRDCPNCGDARRRSAHDFADHSVVSCEACGFVYLPVAVDPSVFIEGALAWEHASELKVARRRKETPWRTRFDMATRFRTKFRKK